MNNLKLAAHLLESLKKNGMTPADAGEVLIYAITILSMGQGLNNFSYMVEIVGEGMYEAKTVVERETRSAMN